MVRPICPRCGQPHDIERGEIGALVTNICDRCYYERFANDPSEVAYFSQNPKFWIKIKKAAGEMK